MSLLTIGQIAKKTKVNIETIRYYEHLGILPKAHRNPNSGYRQYKENIIDYFKNPRNKKELVDPDVKELGENPLCGDEVEIQLKIADGKVVESGFQGKGCAISQSSASMLVEKVEGMSLDDVKKITNDDILEMLGIQLGPVRLKCALLPLKTMENGLK